MMYEKKFISLSLIEEGIIAKMLHVYGGKQEEKQ